MAQEGIVKARQKRNDCQIIQERKATADDEKNLKRDKQDTCNMPHLSWTKREPRHDQFDRMVPSRPEFLEPERREVKIATNGTRDRLCLVMIIKAGENPAAL